MDTGWDNASEGRPVRNRKRTAKGNAYSLDLLHAENKRVLKRLHRQKLLFVDLLQTNNVEMVDREIALLDTTYNEFVENYSQIREVSDPESQELKELMEKVDQEDAEVFDIKTNVSAWMVEQANASERSSRRSRSSKRRATIVASLSGREKRSGSVKSGGSNRSGSVESVGSRVSDISGTSRTSQKAKIAGLKAEIEVLKNEGQKEIEDKSKEMKEVITQYEEEQKRALAVEIAEREREIIENEVNEEKVEEPDRNAERRKTLEQAILNQHSDKPLRVNSSVEEPNLNAERRKILEQAILNQHSNKPLHINPSGNSHLIRPSNNIDNKASKEIKQEINKSEVKMKDVINQMKASTYFLAKDSNKMRINQETSRNEAMNSQDEHLASLNQSMIQMMKAQAAPKVEIDVFSGDSLEYTYFISNFKDIVESSVEDQRGRLNRLIRYTRGEAKDLIKHCVHSDQQSCYDEAMSLLEKEYGNPLHIATAYMKKLKNWPEVKHGDGASMRALYRFLLQCQVYNKRGILTGLDSPLEICNIQKKLPYNLQDKWTHVVGKIRKFKSREANFTDFVELIETESSALNDPVYSRAQRDENNKKEEQKKPWPVKALVTATGHDVKTQEIFTNCPSCKGAHKLSRCPSFTALNVKEKTQFIFDNKLCFKCFNHDHIARNCTEQTTCEVCTKNHHTLLHVYKTNIINQPKDGGAGMCVVPVYLSHTDHPEKQVLVYAMLDECSSGTFIKESLLFREFEEVSKVEREISAWTLNGIKTSKSFTSKNFVVQSTSGKDSQLLLPTVYGQTELPIDKNDIPSKDYIKNWSYLDRVAESLLEEDKDIQIGLLIGRNCPKALEPVEVIPSSNDGPYAYRTRLGWCLGDKAPTNENSSETMKVNFIRFSIEKQVTLHDQEVEKALKEEWSKDTTDKNSEMTAFSNEDRQFLQTMKNNIQFIDGHYQLPLPFRGNPELPCNREYALKRTEGIRRKMLKDEAFKDEYVGFVQNLLERGYARKVEPCSNVRESDCWYLPHHGVMHPTKKKIRVVFDGGAEFKGVSLNSQLLQGPDLTNQLIGVILRLRKEQVAVTGDLECMYYQVRVPESQRKFLRFLFWPDGDINLPPVDHEMCVHVFGAVSSMGCVNYALRQTADDNEEEYGPEAANTLKNEFYVDDMAKSEANDQDAINLIQNVVGMCGAGGFNLTKIVSNSKTVTDSVPIERRSKSGASQLNQHSKIERPLGVQWNIENDSFGFNIDLETGVLTRRGILKAISSIYDILGIASPFLLRGRKILQQITNDKGSWDDSVDAKYIKEWNEWRSNLVKLNNLTFPRCYKPAGFGKVVDISLHSFGDGCIVGYGAACYIRQVDENENIAVALVMGKSRVAPLKSITIPRLELTASTLAIRLGEQVGQELDLSNVRKVYYTDSEIVLGYIKNDTKRFKVFVANRTQMIRAHSEKEQWLHVNTKENPADDASRGLQMSQTLKVERWLRGPSFLYDKDEGKNKVECSTEIDDDDPEVVKAVRACNISEQFELLSTLERRISRWLKMKRVTAMILLFIKKLKRKTNNGNQVLLSSPEQLTVSDIKEAETVIIKMAQARAFQNEVSDLKKENERTEKRKENEKKLSKGRKSKKKAWQLWKLDPFIDEHGVLRVGGRLRNSGTCEELKFPVILPKKTVLSRRIVEHFHRLIHHLGRTSTINEVRSNGYWVVGISTMVRSIIYHCVKCRSLRGSSGAQKMADLPSERISCEPPFTYCGVDMFGPFTVKEGRKEHKRYCALFTCLSSRAIHIEVTASMDTDSFIQALRRFMARRGPVRVMSSDNGGNFVGAENELKQAWKEMDHTKVASYLTANNCDWDGTMAWKKIAPTASHMGGAWERQIGTAKRIFASMMKSSPRLLNNESFCTLMTEVESIVNSRPLTLLNINDPESLPLTPNHLLTYHEVKGCPSTAWGIPEK